MNITKLISTTFDSLNRLIVKVRRLGLADVQTGYQVAPFGYDSNPVTDKKYVPIYGKTGVKGESVIIGYVQQGMEAQPGQVRIYQITGEGTLGAEIWLRNDAIEVGGNSNAIAMYEPLDLALQGQVLDINLELGKIATAINAIVPGAYVPTPIVLDTSAARSTKSKTS